MLEVQTSVAMVEPHLIDSFSHTGLESYPADAAMCTAIAASLGALFQNTMNRRAFAASSGMSALLLALGSEAGVSGELAEDAEAVAAAALQRDTAVVGLLHALLTASSGEEAVTLQEEVAEDEDGIKVQPTHLWSSCRHAWFGSLTLLPPCVARPPGRRLSHASQSTKRMATLFSTSLTSWSAAQPLRTRSPRSLPSRLPPWLSPQTSSRRWRP